MFLCQYKYSFSFKPFRVKGFKSILPKYLYFLPLCLCFALLKNFKMQIFNAVEAIKGTVNVKQFLMKFSITLSERFILTFMIIKAITKFDFGFSNVGTSPQTLCFNKFFGITIQRITLNFKHFQVDFCCKGSSSIYRVTDQIIFLPTWPKSSTLIKKEQCCSD